MEDYIEYQDVKNIGTPFELLSTEEMNEIIGSGSLDNEVSPMSGGLTPKSENLIKTP